MRENAGLVVEDWVEIGRIFGKVKLASSESENSKLGELKAAVVTLQKELLRM